MAKPVMIVAPACRSQQNVERGNRLAPGQFGRLLQPLGVLDRHRSGDHREGFVGRKQAMPSGEQVALKPTMTEMFAEYFHHTPVGRNMIVNRDDRFGRTAILYGEDIPETIRIGLVRTEKAEVLLPGVSRERVSQQLAELTSRLMALRRRP